MADNEVLLIAITNLSDSIKEQNVRHTSFVLKTEGKLDKTDGKIDEIKESMNQYFVLFEKLSNIESKQQETSNRIFNSIELLDGRIKHIEDKPITLMGFITKGFLTAIGAGIFTYFAIKYKG